MSLILTWVTSVLVLVYDFLVQLPSICVKMQ